MTACAYRSLSFQGLCVSIVYRLLRMSWTDLRTSDRHLKIKEPSFCIDSRSAAKIRKETKCLSSRSGTPTSTTQVHEGPDLSLLDIVSTMQSYTVLQVSAVVQYLNVCSCSTCRKGLGSVLCARPPGALSTLLFRFPLFHFNGRYWHHLGM